MSISLVALDAAAGCRTLLAEAGCNDNKIASVLGWELGDVPKMRTIYKASLPGASDASIEKLVEDRQTWAAGAT